MERPSAAWTLLLGPGTRLAGIRPALTAMAEDRLGPDAPGVLALDDPMGLHPAAGEPRGAGRLVIDADAVHPDDLGLVRRFVAARPDWDFLVTGVDEGSRSAKRLLDLHGARWRGWPLDVAQLDALVAPPAPYAQALQAARAPDERPATAATPSQPYHTSLGREELRELEQDLEVIEEILAQEGVPAVAAEAEEAEFLADDDLDPLPMDPPPMQDRLDPRSVDLTPEEIEAFYGPDPVGPTSAGTWAREPGEHAAEVAVAEPEIAAPSQEPPTAEPGHTWSPPPWYRDQVADLADRAQRLHLALETVDPSDPMGQALVHDVLAMTQFARTLGFLASPPARGDQQVDLGTLLEEQLALVAGARPDGPRYLMRPDRDAMVRTDKGLLVAAFDALLQLADACADSDDVVRVSMQTLEDQIVVQVRFPAGPLIGVPTEDVLAPYAVHRLVPRIGPNALAAAGRILQGQGGDLAIGEGDDPGERVLEVRLPRS
ncbi:MAG: hypothetical protein O2816_03925 [Planctomycetota bacterium]|nr:hypothetical protein [Planctomycetota bacterium]